MDLVNMLFKRSPIPTIIPLKKHGDIRHEMHIQTNLISEAGYEILDKFNKGDTVLILYRQFNEDQIREKEMGIFLRLRIITKKGLLHPEPTLKAFFDDYFTKIELYDVDIKEHLVDQGYGSILLDRLIRIAKNRKIHTISGWISKVDEEHLERLVHFYKKHEFKVTLQEKENYNNIGNLLWTNDSR